MELGIFERQLRLMVLLTQNREYTMDELCRKLDLSRRTLYRYLELFRDTGFEVVKQGNVYRLDKSSPFFKEIKSPADTPLPDAPVCRETLSAPGVINRWNRAEIKLLQKDAVIR